jgi:8-oxo-dGTP pyrophosphatase MutT (NUDIX family)
MTNLGVSVAIIHEGKILLTQREDFEIWCLPGGMVEAGESIAAAARREAWEEVGIEVRLTRLVGIYYVGGLMNIHHAALFVGEPLTHAITIQAAEVLDARYFDPADLPIMLHWHRTRLNDALNGAIGIVREQHYRWNFEHEPPMTRQQLYQKRDESGLGRLDFYLKYLVCDAADSAEVG